MQPDPRVFYKVFLELDTSNLLNILSFDSRSMEYLLNDEFASYFNPNYPIFFKNKLKSLKGKIFFRNSIDQTLKSNQLRSVMAIIKYIIKYQNSYVSAFLFKRNLKELIQRGVPVANLLKS